MAQLVGIARALTVRPEILLLDEPIVAVDVMTRITMRRELARIWREEAVTMILVTHDFEEAVYLAYRILAPPRNGGPSARPMDIKPPRPRDQGEARFVQHRDESPGRSASLSRATVQGISLRLETLETIAMTRQESTALITG